MFQGRTIGAVLLGILGLIWIAYSVREIRLAYASNHWPKAEGTITAVSAKPVEREKRFGSSESPITKEMSFRISYQYAVNGSTYIGNRLMAGLWLPISEFGTRELIARYHEGGKVQVYYDPAQPEVSLLEPGFDPYFVVALVGGYFLLVIGILIMRAKFKAPA